MYISYVPDGSVSKMTPFSLKEKNFHQNKFRKIMKFLKEDNSAIFSSLFLYSKQKCFGFNIPVQI